MEIDNLKHDGHKKTILILDVTMNGLGQNCQRNLILDVYEIGL